MKLNLLLLMSSEVNLTRMISYIKTKLNRIAGQKNKKKTISDEHCF